jgi:Flp pilus assembly protein TadG
LLHSKVVLMNTRVNFPSPRAALRRRGFVIPFTAVCITLLIGMVALAVDLGMISVARTQAQHTADMAALAGARTFTGDSASNYNATNVRPMVDAVTLDGNVLQKQVQTNQVAMQVRPYIYSPSLGRFPVPGDFPAPGGTTGAGADQTVTVSTGQTVPTNAFGWSMVRVTVGESAASQPVTNDWAFGKVFGATQFGVNAVATAVHRPRDLALILDFSGSMGYSSTVRSGGSMVRDGDPEATNPTTTPGVPNFAYYRDVPEYQANGSMVRTTPIISGAYVYAPSNIVVATPGGDAIVRDFHTRNTSGVFSRAFHRSAGAYTPTVMPQTPAPNNFRNQTDTPIAFHGDKWPRKNNTPSNNEVATVQEVVFGNTTAQPNNHAKDLVFETTGYGLTFNGFTMGPGYYGKTFYIWPPDPRTPSPSGVNIGDVGYVAGDWRQRFYVNGSSTTGVNTPGAALKDNSLLFNGDGQVQTAASTRYRVNYNAVLDWINHGPQVFPPNLRSGRVLYYSEIPTTIRATIANGGNATSQTDDATMNELFWKRYIDYVLAASGTYGSQLFGAPSGTGATGGAAWGTVKITARSLLTATPPPYMHYNDNPRHPRLHFWFGPMSMISFIWDQAGNQLPGTCHESQSWQLKTGIQAALLDIERNHPNDVAALIYFSSKADFNTARVQMSRNYAKMRNALWFPFQFLDNLSNASLEGRPYTTSMGDNTNNMTIPNADGSTCPEMAFKVSYNEFGERPTGHPGGAAFGRKGAQKMVIYETDGIPNTVAGPSTSATEESDFITPLGSPYVSYWNKAQFNSSAEIQNLGDMNSTVITRAKNAMKRICAPTTADASHVYNSFRPGFGDKRAPVEVHAIGFGDLFEPATPPNGLGGTSQQNNALDFLNDIEVIGLRVTNGATYTRPRSVYHASGKVIFGDSNQRIEGIRSVMENIMQSGTNVSLIE